MNEMQKTLSVVGVAAVLFVSAIFSAPGSPKEVGDFADLGQTFFPEFKEVSQATSLQVATYDSATAEVNVFQVAYKDGKWLIPSRYDYPSDAKDRLSKTATSLMGIEREALVGRNATQHAEFGVIDPLSETVKDLQGVGNRITLRQGEEALADLIIGKQVPNRAGYFYIRRVDEPKVYIAKLELEVSTRFADWIEPDLLKLDEFKLKEVIVDKYSVDLTRGRLADKERSVLSRPTTSEPWILEPINPATEQVNMEEVRKLTSALGDLKIVGVRPKPVKLQRDLRLAEGIQLTEAIEVDLQQRGFFFAQTPDGSSRLVSKEGDVVAATEDGVVYELHFGEVFAGSDKDAEKGILATEEGAENKPATDQPADSAKKNRYLMVMVSFDPTYLGTKPVEPVAPTAPPETTPPAEAASGAETPADATTPANTTTANTTPEPTPQQVYQQELAQYESAKQAYPGLLKAYEDRVAAGEKQVKELNARFAEWYYVISAENFENLRQGRKTLVQEKGATPADEGAAGGSMGPGGVTLPGGLESPAGVSEPGSAESGTNETTPGETGTVATPATTPATPEPATPEPATPEPAVTEPPATEPAPAEPAAPVSETPVEPAAPAAPEAGAASAEPVESVPGTEPATVTEPATAPETPAATTP